MIISDNPKIFWFLDEYMQNNNTDKLKNNLILYLRD